MQPQILSALLRTLAGLCLLVMLQAGQVPATEAAQRIDTLGAVVTADEHLPPPVQARMEKSVQAIGEQLLEGKDVNAVRAEQRDYENIIRQVFDKVLVGYTVDDVRLRADETATVEVNLTAWQDCIENVTVTTSVEGMSLELEQLLREDVAGIDNIFTESLQGLPIAAVDWTQGLLKKQVASFLEEHAPEFKADFDVNVAENTEVKLNLYALLPVVRTVDLSMRSDTILNAALLMKRQKMQDNVNHLIGMPVHFVARHQAEIEQQLGDVLNNDTECQFWDVTTKVAVTPKENLAVMSRSDSDAYRVRLEGWADVGNDYANQNDTSLMARLHVGRMLSKQDELFTQLDFYPEAVKWDWDIGYHHQWESGTLLGLRYNPHDDYFKFDFEQPLAKKWLFRYEYRDDDSRSEYGIRYRLHDFLAIELARDSHDNWLRFIGYF